MPNSGSQSAPQAVRRCSARRLRRQPPDPSRGDRRRSGGDAGDLDLNTPGFERRGRCHALSDNPGYRNSPSVSGSWWGDRHFRPHRFAQRVTRRRTPARGQGVHQEQSSARLTLRSRRRRGRGGPFRGGRVRDLDADQVRRRVEGESEAEVMSGHTAVPHGVRGEFGDDEGDGARRVRRRRVPPLLHVPDGTPPGQPRTSRRRGELRYKRRQFTLYVGRLCQHCVFRPCPSSREMSHGVRDPSRSAFQIRPIALRSTGDAALPFSP